MSDLTKLADFGDRSVHAELLERIEQLEAQDGPGYGPCLEFYKRIAADIVQREEAAFRGGFWSAYSNVSQGHSYSKHEETVNYYLWCGLDAHGNEG